MPTRSETYSCHLLIDDLVVVDYLTISHIRYDLSWHFQSGRQILHIVITEN
jgi:hypothetical protein